MVNNCSACVTSTGRTPTLQSHLWEKSTVQWTSSYAHKQAHDRMPIHSQMSCLYSALFNSVLTHCHNYTIYWVAIAFFLGFLRRLRPLTLVFNKLEYAVVNISTSLCSTTVDNFLLLDCARIKHLYSGFLTAGVPSLGCGLVRPSSRSKEFSFLIIGQLCK